MMMARLLRHALTPWLWLALAITTSGCALAAPTTVAVPVTAVNYTGKELSSFLFIDVNDPDKVAGGPPLTPFTGAGSMCCYALPLKWHAGIKAKLRYSWYHDGPEPDQDIELVSELPPYPTGEPGMLWALFYDDGSVQVIASAVDPGHPKWPGKINHWPIPSREYRLKLWQMDYDEIARGIPYTERMMKGLSPEDLKKAWDTRARYDENSIKGFSGADDPRFEEALKKEGAESLARMRARLAELEQRKP